MAGKKIFCMVTVYRGEEFVVFTVEGETGGEICQLKIIHELKTILFSLVLLFVYIERKTMTFFLLLSSQMRTFTVIKQQAHYTVLPTLPLVSLLTFKHFKSTFLCLLSGY